MDQECNFPCCLEEGICQTGKIAETEFVAAFVGDYDEVVKSEFNFGG